MKYMGGKTRLAPLLLPKILRGRYGRTYVEPFVGGGNMIEQVTGPRIGADNNYELICALKQIRDNPTAFPATEEEFSEIDYQNMRMFGSKDPALHAYVGFALSWGAKWFGGWARNGQGCDYVKNAYRNAQLQSPKLKDVDFRYCSYDNLDIPPNSIIYCDPPYEGVTEYRDPFDHDRFWKWCRKQHEDGHRIYVSEQNAPPDFLCIFSRCYKYEMCGKNAHERLYTLPWW